MLISFLSGAVVMGFWLAGVVQALLAFSSVPVEDRSWLYFLCFAAFLLILAAIWRKNRRARG